MLNNVVMFDRDFEFQLETILLKYLNIVFTNIFVDIVSILSSVKYPTVESVTNLMLSK